MMRSMYCGGRVDHGGEEVCTAAHEPTHKSPTPNKETSLPACLISVRPQSTTKSADLAEKEKLKNKTKLGV